MEKTRDELIQEWNRAQKELIRAKEYEMSLRNKVIELSFPAHKDKGTENVELGGGWKLKAVFKQSVTFVNSNKNDEVDKALSKLEKMGPEGAFIAERIVKWKPELSITEYEKLDNKYKKVIDEIIVTKPATPSLELVEPKVKE